MPYYQEAFHSSHAGDSAVSGSGILIDSEDRSPGASGDRGVDVPTVSIWGLTLARISTDELLDLVDRLIERGEPNYFITANLHYAMLSDRDARLEDVNRRAAFLVADGMPLVWWSHWKGCPVPERVTGADTIYRLCQRASERGHRVFLLGGGAGVAQEAADRLCWRYPGLHIVGVESPVLSDMTAEEHDALLGRIARARADLLFVALGQPKGEVWLAENLDALGPVVCVQVGASFDFVAGRVARAPRWMQHLGAEWLYRVWCEPRRLIPRYLTDAVFMFKAVWRDVVG